MKRTRWTGRILGGLLALAPATGCKQQIFLEPADFKTALEAQTVAQLEFAPHDAVTPPAVVPGTTPANVLDPTRPPKYVTLKECIAIALEQGNVGFPPTNNAGLVLDQLATFSGRSTGTDTIKAFALDPAIAAAEIERSLSKFDARYVASMTWQKVDQAQPAAFQASLQNGDQASLATTLAKPLPTGGIAGITFNTTYRNLSNPPGQNTQISALPTSYSPQLQFTFEQPLLQSFGVEVNQLLTQHPGSILIPGLQPSGGVGTEGILVTRIRQDQARSEFDRNVNNMMFNLETAYWNLFSAYYNLFAQEEGLKQSYDAYRIIEERVRAGVARPPSLYQYKAQVELFRGQVLTARGQVLTAERSLRGFMGMRSDDGTRLVPVDDPTLVPYRPDFYELANDAVQNRPEIMIARQELKAQQMNLVLQRNNRRPDLRLLTQYDVNAIAPSLRGDTPATNAFSALTANTFNNWQVGLRLNMPIGFRDANAQVREAELNLKKAYFFLTDSERKAQEYLTEQYRLMLQSHELIKYRRAQREALETFVARNIDIFNQGAIGPGEFEGFIANLVQAQRDLANATASEFQAVAQYNTALAGVEYAKGTIQRYNNVTIADGPAPKWVEKKAADHFAARNAALKLREHPSELGAPPLSQWEPIANLPPYPGPAGTTPPPPTDGQVWKDFPQPKDGGPNGGNKLPTPQPLNGDTKPRETAPPSKLLMAPPTTAPAPLPLTTTPSAIVPVAPVSVPAAAPDATFKPIGTVSIPARTPRPAAAASGDPTTPAPTVPALPALPVQGASVVSPVLTSPLNSPAMR